MLKKMKGGEGQRVILTVENPGNLNVPIILIIHVSQLFQLVYYQFFLQNKWEKKGKKSKLNGELLKKNFFKNLN